MKHRHTLLLLASVHASRLFGHPTVWQNSVSPQGKRILLSCCLFMLLLTGLACAMSERLAMGMKEPTPTRVRRLVVFPVARSTPVPNLAASAFDPGLVGASAWTTPGASAQLAGLTFDSPIATPFAFATPVPFNLPTFPTATPTPIATSTPAFDFVLAEFYNSPTSNSFLMVYVW
ncbi:MAG: hypothetical protein U0401_16405 [Anaerolineae bacterium]